MTALRAHVVVEREYFAVDVALALLLLATAILVLLLVRGWRPGAAR